MSGLCLQLPACVGFLAMFLGSVLDKVLWENRRGTDVSEKAGEGLLQEPLRLIKFVRFRKKRNVDMSKEGVGYPCNDSLNP